MRKICTTQKKGLYSLKSQFHKRQRQALERFHIKGDIIKLITSRLDPIKKLQDIIGSQENWNKTVGLYKYLALLIFLKLITIMWLHERISLFLEIYTEEFRDKRHDISNFFSKKFKEKNMYPK